MSKLTFKYWPILFCMGALLSYLLDTGGMDFVEIHYRLFLIMGLTIISFGGFLLSMFPPVVSLLICIAVVVGWYWVINKRTKN